MYDQGDIDHVPLYLIKAEIFPGNQHTVSSFAQQFSQNTGKAQEPKQEEADARPTPPPRTESAASGTRPVNVQFPDGGSVDVRDDGDGYHEADIR